MKKGAPIDNKNAEKWSINDAKELFEKCLELAQDKSNESNDFIGEIAQDAGTTLAVLDYLKSKYPELSELYKDIKSNCEANCFRNGKKGKINPSLAIMNLKSNHKWTDRNDITSDDKPIEVTSITWGSKEIKV